MLRAPEFWWRPQGLLALSLAPLALLYGWVAAARMKRVGEKINVSVICTVSYTHLTLPTIYSV